jgi:hypothetical protein
MIRSPWLILPLNRTRELFRDNQFPTITILSILGVYYTVHCVGNWAEKKNIFATLSNRIWEAVRFELKT